MADGEVKINTKLDNSGLDKGLKDMKNKLNGAGKDLKGLNAGAVAAAAGMVGVSVAVKKTVDALDDCAAAYRVQKNAEEALQIAVKNNPYLNNESVYNLRNFASELQSLSEIGDEVSIKVMAQLAATGRNEEQIMSIMSAAADMAAVTGQDIASAAQQLNATLNGNAGALGRQIAGINNLTKAELESGKAIELVAKQYKGAAAATADVEVQLSNAWGDFKENIGAGWQNVTQPVKKFFLDVLNDINEATSKTRTLKEQSLGQSQGAFTAEQLKKLIDEKQAILDKALEEETKDLKESQDRLKEWADFWGLDVNDPNLPALPPVEEYSGAVIKAATNTEMLRIEIDELKKEYDQVTESEKAAADAAKAAAAAQAAADAKTRDEKAAEHINAVTQALQEQIKAIELKAEVTGEEVKAGDIYNAYLNSYIDLISKSNGLVSENNQAAKTHLLLLQEWAKKAAEAATEEERLAAAQKAQEEAQKAQEEIAKTARELINEDADERIKLIEDIKNNEILSEEEKAAAIKKIDEQIAQEKKDHYAELAAEVSSYVQQTQQILDNAAALMLKNIELENAAELASLENRYEKGEMSETEYYEKSKELKRKAAQEEYKIKMFEWTASVLAATANIAEGVTKAIAQGGLITGALVGAAGAVQIASIIASKPVPPQFYAGGIIGGANGATYGSDNTYIHARTGEMVLNAHQQRSLWDMINGQDSRQQAGLNLTVNNTQANRVDANVREQDNEVFIDILDKHINKGFTDGTYDAGFAAMNTRQEGVRIL